jgi:short-subunit dehydrogenase
MANEHQLAVVTGASTGIGFELAKCFAEDGYDLIIAAEEPAITAAAEQLMREGGAVHAVQADLATEAGVEALWAVIQADGRPVAALAANAGRGLGDAFLDQDFSQIRYVIETNVTGTLDLLQRIARNMRTTNAGRILITGSIAGFIPGSYQAVYNGTKAFLDSFAAAIRNELKDTDVTVTCLMPGATDTEFFERADMLDTKVGTAKKDDPADVARAGYDALMRGDAEIVSGWKNKLQTLLASVAPSELLAEMHRRMAEPGTAEKK